VEAGRFADEVVPVEIKTRKAHARSSSATITSGRHDDGDLARLPTAFRKDGSVTAAMRAAS
jgi:acetyl-CoA acetyltransferase